MIIYYASHFRDGKNPKKNFQPQQDNQLLARYHMPNQSKIHFCSITETCQGRFDFPSKTSIRKTLKKQKNKWVTEPTRGTAPLPELQP